MWNRSFCAVLATGGRDTFDGPLQGGRQVEKRHVILDGARVLVFFDGYSDYTEILIWKCPNAEESQQRNQTPCIRVSTTNPNTLHVANTRHTMAKNRYRPGTCLSSTEGGDARGQVKRAGRGKHAVGCVCDCPSLRSWARKALVALFGAYG